MLAATRRTAGTTALRSVLGIVLLTLACALGLTVTDAGGAGSTLVAAEGTSISTTAATAADPVPGPAAHQVGTVDRADPAALSAGAGSASSGGHADEGLVLLCLCALLVATVLLTAHQRPARWLAMGLRAVVHHGVPELTIQRSAPDPLTWGVSRT